PAGLVFLLRNPSVTETARQDRVPHSERQVSMEAGLGDAADVNGGDATVGGNAASERTAERVANRAEPGETWAPVPSRSMEVLSGGPPPLPLPDDFLDAMVDASGNHVRFS